MIFDAPTTFDDAAASGKVLALLSECDVGEVRDTLPIIRRRASAHASAVCAVQSAPLVRALSESANLSLMDGLRLLRGAAAELACNEDARQIVGGLVYSVENPKGSVRTGTDASGRSWAVVMPADYGYVNDVEGADGDEVDAFLGDAPWSTRVWVADMVDPETGEWDEHKCFVGFADEETVCSTLKAAYDDGAAERLAGLTEMGLDEFAAWLRDGRRKDEPVEAANQEPAKKHVIPDFRERLTQLRQARQRDFAHILDRIAHIGTMRTADELSAAVSSLRDDLPKLGEKVMHGGRTSRIVAEMLAEAFARSLVDGGNPKKVIRR